MVYRFDREWNGEVIAEHRRPYLEPFFGLRYPESDIPAQARRLYTLNRLRFIVDSRATAARLVPREPEDGEGELDLSFAPLRSVSPVHLEYLRGMGVRASMSISMIRNGVPAFTDHLNGVRPGLGTESVAGALVLPLAPGNWILWLNPAVKRTVRWAGDPQDKTITIRVDGTARIGPRRSFEAAEQRLRGRSAVWDSWQVQAVTALGAAAIAQLRRYEQDAVSIVEDLQGALRPAHLPHLPGVDLEVRYVPAPDGRFAGDWWDCFELPSGKLALVVGDVTGHGSAVTATMTQLRTALRAYLLEGAPPAETLARLDALANLVFRPTLATVVLALFDPVTGGLEIVRAGHPHPLLATADGARPVLIEARPPIGLGVESPAASWTGSLAPGDTLVLYTDGLSEDRQASPEEGIQRIATALAPAAAEPLKTLADTLIDAGPRPRTDDLTLLIVRRA
jgi:hypothetical protein